MVKIRERFHKIAFLITRILSLVISLAWLGLAIFVGNVLYKEFVNWSPGVLTARNSVKQLELILSAVFIGLPCLIQILLSIFIQQRKKWAIAGMFLFTAIELGIAISVFIAEWTVKGMSVSLIGHQMLFPLFMVIILGAGFLYVLAESNIAINLEKISQKGFEVINAPGVIQVPPDSTGQPIDKTE